MQYLHPDSKRLDLLLELLVQAHQRSGPTVLVVANHIGLPWKKEDFADRKSLRTAIDQELEDVKICGHVFPPGRNGRSGLPCQQLVPCPYHSKEKKL